MLIVTHQANRRVVVRARPEEQRSSDFEQLHGSGIGEFQDVVQHVNSNLYHRYIVTSNTANRYETLGFTREKNKTRKWRKLQR